MQNPLNYFRKEGVPNGRITALPQNFDFELNMDTWWSAVRRARDFSDFTGLDALYSYVMKSSTLVRAAVDKRLRPLKSRTFSVVTNGRENERLTALLADSALMRSLLYNYGMANFTYARVVGVERNLETFVYPLRNLDVVNKAVKRQTYDTKGSFYVKSHVNLFWMQTDYDSEDTLGLLEPIARDYINLGNAQNNWQTASQFLAYQQMVMYYENGDEKMEHAARRAAEQVGLGKVLVSGKTFDEMNKTTIKDIELENVNTGSAADTFRIFKENIDSLSENICLVVLGSSLLMKSAKNTNSERLVRAHLKGFNDILESDAIGAQDWLNKTENKTKLAYLLNEPELANATLKVKPQSYIDTGDIETFVKMLVDLQLEPTDTFIKKTGLDKQDVVGYGNSKTAIARSEAISKLREESDATRSVTRVVVDSAKRFFNRNRPVDREEVAG